MQQLYQEMSLFSLSHLNAVTDPLSELHTTPHRYIKLQLIHQDIMQAGPS